jgi:hypothetical protein
LDTFTFRLERDLKSAFLKLAESQDKPAGEILRELIGELVKTKQHSDFVKEARRQSKIIAASASNSSSDEAEVLSQLDKAFDELSTRKDWQ